MPQTNSLNPNSDFVMSSRFIEIQNMLLEHILSRIENLGAEFGRWNRQRIDLFVNNEIASYIIQERLPLNEIERSQIASSITKELAGLGPLEDLLQDPSIEDILINGAKAIFVSRNGVLTETPSQFKDDAHVLRIVRRILAPLGRRLDESSPMVDARLPDGGRLNAIIEPLSVDGPSVSIRKFKKDPLTPENLIAFGSFNEEIAHLLKAAVCARCNILISGGTSSGKTSLLNALAYYIPKQERILTVEDTAELSLNHPHVVRLEARQAGFDGSGEISIRDLIRNSLRMRPDRVVVGEVRGAEVMDMLQAMSTGHDGSMATIHANSARECLDRIEMLAGFDGFAGSEQSLRRQIASAIDFIIQVARLPNGKRRVISVTEILGMSDSIITTQELYKYEPQYNADEEEIEQWRYLGIKPHNLKLKNYQPYETQTQPSELKPNSSQGGFWSRRHS